MQDYTSAPVASPPTRSGSRTMTLFIALVAFVLGAAIVAWAASRGYLSQILPEEEGTEASALGPVEEPTGDGEPSGAAAVTPPADQMAAIGTVEGRVAMLEDRISRLDFQSSAASGNAARAEGLLIAFAARRLIDRGEPLGYVTDQLRLRFMNAQPHAVETVIAFSKNPVTLGQLSARLEALSPDLAQADHNQSAWERARYEIASLFTVHRDSPALASPSARIARAKIMLIEQRIDNAISDVKRLPGAEAADKWIADARRYQEAQRALDLLETTAMLEPSRLQDAGGNKVNQPSPLAAPATAEMVAPEPEQAP